MLLGLARIKMLKPLLVEILSSGQTLFSLWNVLIGNKVSKKFRALLKEKRLICLDIPDNYDRMDPVLVRLLENGVSKHVRLR